MKLCIVCHERPPEVPDRDAYPDRRKRVCRQCHGERLRGDLKGIYEAYAGAVAREKGLLEVEES